MQTGFKGLAIGVSVGLLGFGLYLTPAGRFLEQHIGLDWLFNLRGAISAPPQVTVVALDKASSRALNLPEKPLKWPRSHHAKVIDALQRNGARVIAFDVLFKDPGDLAQTDNLGQTIQQAGNVLLFQYMDMQRIDAGDNRITLESLESPVTALADAAVAVAPFPLPKVPAKVSQFWVFKENMGGVPTLPAVAVQLYLMPYYQAWRTALLATVPALAPDLPADGVDMLARQRLIPGMIAQRRALTADAGRALALDDYLAAAQLDDATRHALRSLQRLYQGTDNRYLNFIGPARSVRTVPFYRIFNGETESLNAMRDQIVLIGLSEPLQLERVDTFYTPFSQDDGVEISGVEIMATAVANLLQDTSLRPLANGWILVLFLVWSWFMAQLPRLLRITTRGLAAVTVVAVVYFFTASGLFASSQIWLPVIIPLFFLTPLAVFATLVRQYREIQREKLKIRRAFGYYVPERVIDEIAQNFSRPQIEKKVVSGTCMATDAERYTSLAETLAAPDLGRLLDQYYAKLFQPVNACNGVVSDVVGDAMMAIWTSAHNGVEHRQQACQAALAILELDTLYAVAGRELALRTRIGLHAGEMLLGNVGALNHYEYRAVGDIINTTARIEGLGKQLNRLALASADVLQGLDNIHSQYLGRFLLAGKTTSVEIHGLLTDAQHKDLLSEALPQFAHALDDFQQGRWPQALPLFADLASRYDDGVSRFYCRLCDQYMRQQPGQDWCGEVVMHRK